MTDREAKELEGRVKTLEEKVNALEAQAAKEPMPVGGAPVVEDSETFMYHEKHPKGKKFKTSEVGKLGKDWVNSPAKLK